MAFAESRASHAAFAGVMLPVALGWLVPALPSPAFASSEDDQWSREFGMPGTDGAITRMTVFDGRLIVAGDFSLAGNEPARGVAAWDGAGWSSVGDGLSDVEALVIWNDSLIACGDSWPDTVLAHGFARWDGSRWVGFGPPADDSHVHVMAVYRDHLIAGGSIHLPPASPGADSTFRVVEWDGVSWRGISAGPDRYSDPSAIAVYRDELIVAGSFDAASGDPGTGVIRWDGATWRPLGDGVLGWISAFAVWNGDLYAAGSLRLHAEDTDVPLLRWDGAGWSYLATEPDSIDGRVLAVIDDHLYVAGYGGGTPLLRWDGAAWEHIDPSPSPEAESGYIYAVAEYGGELIAAGGFTLIGDQPGRCIAAWNGAGWRGLGPPGAGLGRSTRVNRLAHYRGQVVAAGGFHSAGGIAVSNIAAWDGVHWNALGEGLNGEVKALLVRDDTLYAGGRFQASGDVPVRFVARWDGVSWSGVGSGMDDEVDALALSGGELYAGGEFLLAGSTPANRIARWDGSEWHALGEGVRDPVWGRSAVLVLLPEGDSLLVGGSFTQAGSLHSENLAVWRGGEWRRWSSSPTATRGSVHALLRYQGDLLCANYGVSRWTGTEWDALGSSWVETLAECHGELIGGGEDYGLSGRVGIARWDGWDWNPLGSGTNSRVLSLLALGDDLYVGGDFVMAGGHAAYGFARWRYAPRIDLVAPQVTLDLTPYNAPGGLVDVTVTSSERLPMSSVQVVANDRPVELRSAAPDGLSWSGWFRFAGTLEFVTVSAEATDAAGNVGRGTGDIAGFSALEIRAGNAVSPDSRLQLRFGGELREGYYATVRALGAGSSLTRGPSLTRGASTAGPFLARYEIGPYQLMEECPLVLDFDYEGMLEEGVDPRRLSFVGPDSVALETTCDPARHTITAASCESGRYGIALADSAISPLVEPGYFRLVSAYPNPFVESLHMVFETRSREPLRVDVFDTRGRRIGSLYDGTVGVGVHAVTWDGRTQGGTRAAPGVYFVDARAGSARLTRRVVLTR